MVFCNFWYDNYFVKNLLGGSTSFIIKLVSTLFERFSIVFQRVYFKSISVCTEHSNLEISRILCILRFVAKIQFVDRFLTEWKCKKSQDAQYLFLLRIYNRWGKLWKVCGKQWLSQSWHLLHLFYSLYLYLFGSAAFHPEAREPGDWWKAVIR